ncbi:MAG: hypothetical protein JWN52_7788 [Actinomycetia bacterium]|jgi:hypothetical protein|nr:hypothetical protein [Actinomycetes bacterium]
MTVMPPDIVVIETAIDHLDQLAERLRADGWEAWLTVSSSHLPYVLVLNPKMRALNDEVIAAPDAAGDWWYWWSWAERIAPVDDAAQVVVWVARVLAAEQP